MVWQNTTKYCCCIILGILSLPTPQNIVAVFPKENFKIGDFVNVKITDCTSATLIGEASPLKSPLAPEGGTVMGNGVRKIGG